jgi:hypothetical protein
MGPRVPGCVRSHGFFVPMGTAAIAGTSSSFSGGGWGERLQQRGHSENVNHPFEIVI